MKLNRVSAQRPVKYPERILQFGEGNFLRSFVDWMVDIMNEKANFNSGVVVAQPISQGMADFINKQDGLYHLCLRGMNQGKPIEEFRLIESINRAINPYTEFNKYISLASSPELRFIISNTTEAGISYDQNDTFEMTPQQSFPAKVTSFLYKRFQHFKGAPDKGIILICCELIDRNADNLHKLVNRYIEKWGLEESFKTWIDTSCAFCNSLVDRIVPGYPREEAPALCEKLGYEDQLITVGEYFHLWVIEAPEWVRKEFPAPAAGLDVRFVDDMTAYRERKVRVLNGAHTGTVALSLLSGIGTVRESIEDPVLGGFMRKMVYDEILLPLEGDKEDLKVFADRILERFYNPFVKHQWTSIALNSLSKWVTRNEPSLVDYYHKTGKAPQCLTLSLAALILYYRGSYQGKSFTPQDDAINIQVMDQAWEKYNTHHSIHLLLKDIFENGSWWNKNLLKEIPELSAALEQCIKELLNNPAKDVISKIAQLS